MIEFREISNDERENIFDFLEDLRDSGQINMFGAAPYIVENFGLNGKARNPTGFRRWDEWR